MKNATAHPLTPDNMHVTVQNVDANGAPVDYPWNAKAQILSCECGWTKTIGFTVRAGSAAMTGHRKAHGLYR